MPKKVLEEEEYIDSLSSIIARDFYPLLSAPNQTVNLSLDQFQTEYTSQDNYSFNQIIDKSNAERLEKYRPFYEQKLIKAQPAEGSIDTWNHKIKNNLIFGPEGIDQTLPNTSKKIISHSNTRLDSMPPPSIIPVKTILKNTNQESFELVPNTPSIAPGIMFDPSELMTWGSIEGTPIRVDQNPGFQIPPTPIRELIGIQLAEKAKKPIKRSSAASRLLARSKKPY